MVLAIEGDTATAAYFIFAAAVFDFCDGFAARLLNARSQLGLQLDSLADALSFGAAPSAMIYSLLRQGLPDGWPVFAPFLAFLIVVFSALRLAKFNIDERQSESFIGLPTPACALIICGLPFMQNRIDGEILFYLTAALIPILSFLLICELPMFSLKIKKQNSFSAFARKYLPQILLLIFTATFLILFGILGLSLGIASYILLSAVFARFLKSGKCRN
jgi:CDP-diacylglycerol--serine O-phosphatidyltransferase